MKRPLPDGLLVALWWAFVDNEGTAPEQGVAASYIPTERRVRAFREWIAEVWDAVPNKDDVEAPFVAEYKRQEQEDFRGPTAEKGGGDG